MSKYHMPSFSKLIADVGDTETDQQLTRDFNELVRKLESHAEVHGSAKGALAITVGVAIDPSGKVSVAVSNPKLTFPAAKLGSSVYFIDANGDGESVLSKRNPKQRELFEDTNEERGVTISFSRPEAETLRSVAAAVRDARA